MTLKQLSTPNEILATLPEVKNALRVDHALDDARIESLIKSAYRYICARCSRAIHETEYENVFTVWDALTLSPAPVLDVSSVQAVSGNTVEDIDEFKIVGQTLVLTNGFPSGQGEASPLVRVLFTAGYAEPPEAFKIAQIEVVRAWYDSSSLNVAHSILSPFRYDYL